MTRQIWMMTAVLLLGACAVGPDYREPETPSTEYVNAATPALQAEPFEAAWWKQLGDPALDDLIARALASELSLRIAEARLRESRAIFRDSRLDQFPTVTAAGLYDTREQQQPPFIDQRIESDLYQLGFDASWELDLFGRVRRGVEAARATAEAAEEQLHVAQVSVAAEVARNYLELRGAQRRLAVARANLENQRETVRLTRVRFELGRGSELDVASAEARLAATQASIPPLVAAEQTAINRLAVLLAQRPGSLDLTPRPIGAHLAALAIGAPDQLLRRRPDVRAAERSLAAATAQIGVATADLFPRVDLSGFFGFIAGDADQLGESAARAWSLTPSISWAAFDLGSVRARLRAAEARADAQLAAYEQTVLRALEETENAFVAYSQNQLRLSSLLAQASASRRAAELARIRYREGALDFLRLLDAERTVLEAEDAVAQAETALNTSVVAIYKALGGGWEADEAQLAAR